MDYEIWIEGYAATGDHGTAQYLGVYSGDSFQMACRNALIANAWDMSFYNDVSNTYWACHFYDNEKDARQHFG